MMFSAALQEVTEAEDDMYQEFSTLGDDGLGRSSLTFLSESQEKVEIIASWIQRLIVMNADKKVIPIPAPILSRVFQELSNGMVDMHAAQKISRVPFPFPYSQIISVLLLVHFLSSPVIAALLIRSIPVATFVTFTNVFIVWSINYIAAELEMPFGCDPNDLPIKDIQMTFNKCLRILVQPMTQTPPSFHYDPKVHAALNIETGPIPNYGRCDSCAYEYDDEVLDSLAEDAREDEVTKDEEDDIRLSPEPKSSAEPESLAPNDSVENRRPPPPKNMKNLPAGRDVLEDVAVSLAEFTDTNPFPTPKTKEDPTLQADGSDKSFGRPQSVAPLVNDAVPPSPGKLRGAVIPFSSSGGLDLDVPYRTGQISSEDVSLAFAATDFCGPLSTARLGVGGLSSHGSGEGAARLDHLADLPEDDSGRGPRHPE